MTVHDIIAAIVTMETVLEDIREERESQIHAANHPDLQTPDPTGTPLQQARARLAYQTARLVGVIEEVDQAIAAGQRA